MKILDDFRLLFYRYFKVQEQKRREMKRVFQWRRYLEWNDLSPEEKLSAKRFLLIPVFAYLIIGILNQNLFLIVLLLIGYVFYKKFEGGKIEKNNYIAILKILLPFLNLLELQEKQRAIFNQC